MKTTRLMAYALVGVLALSTSCMDDKYDLSDIDKTVRVDVDDLIIPVNIDPVQLKNILEETEDIQVIDGVYTYSTDGTFSSDPVKIEEISIKIVQIEPSNVEIKSIGGLPVQGYDITYDISNADLTRFDIKANDITEDLKGLTHIDGQTTFTITLNMDGIKQFSSKAQLHDVQLMLPKHLYVEDNPKGTYNPETGVFSVKDDLVDTDKNFVLPIKITGIDIVDGEFDYDSHSIHIVVDAGFSNGSFTLPAQYHLAFLPENLNMYVSYHFDDFQVTYVDGTFGYNVESPKIPTVNLNDLPDFLNQPSTNLVFANPCLYLKANNPLYEYNIYVQTGLAITANRKDKPSQTYSIDEPYFTIGKNTSAANGVYSFVLAPEMPKSPDANYPNPQFVGFNQLSYLLSGDGLPNSLDVKIDNIEFPAQKIDKFKVGTQYPGIEGSYKFIAPFAFKEGSQIVYGDTISGWSSEDLDALTITNLEVNATISTTIPLAVSFTGYPIDKNGNRIAGTSIEGANLSANAKDQNVTIRVKGEIKKLDGIEFVATATSGSEEALSPDMTITLKNIRPKVKGYYQKEL